MPARPLAVPPLSTRVRRRLPDVAHRQPQASGNLLDRALGIAKAASATAMIPRVLAANAAEALLTQGLTAEALALIDPPTTMPPGRDQLPAQVVRAETGLLCGAAGAVTQR